MIKTFDYGKMPAMCGTEDFDRVVNSFIASIGDDYIRIHVDTRQYGPVVIVEYWANLKTPAEWLRDEEFLGFEILDPDGWRKEGSPSFEDPITRDDFRTRLQECTVKFPEGYFQR